MTALQPQAPVLVFRRPYFGSAKGGREDIIWFPSADAFARTSYGEIREKILQGALFVDVTGMSWRVLDMVDLGRRENWLLWIWNKFHRGDNRFVHYELREEGPLPFEAIRNRVCTCILRSPDVWCDWRLLGSKGRRSKEVRDVLEAKAAKVRQATDMRDLFAALDSLT